ncbi:MAG: DUF4406 domain-containing protein [Peptococcaceae bacterium]|nr:DUF4406 domain-containing protein [Peptococcaceae bacterium]
MNSSRKKFRVVYVAHPLASDPPGNIEKVKIMCKEIAFNFSDVLPVTPLLTFSFLREPEDRERALAYCQSLLLRCDELWLAGDWRSSKGCLLEKQWAEGAVMPVFEYSGGVLRWVAQ